MACYAKLKLVLQIDVPFFKIINMEGLTSNKFLLCWSFPQHFLISLSHISSYPILVPVFIRIHIPLICNYFWHCGIVPWEFLSWLMRLYEKVSMDIPNEKEIGVDISIFWLPPASTTHIWPIDFVFSKSKDLYVNWRKI